MEHPMDASAEPELFWERNFLGQQKHGAGEVSRLFYFQAVSVKARQPYELIFSGWVLICWLLPAGGSFHVGAFCAAGLSRSVVL